MKAPGFSTQLETEVEPVTPVVTPPGDPDASEVTSQSYFLKSLIYLAPAVGIEPTTN
jgi:hypothetical protein